MGWRQLGVLPRRRATKTSADPPTSAAEAGSRERHRVARAGARELTAAGAAGPTAAARSAAARGPGRRRHEVLRDRRRPVGGVVGSVGGVVGVCRRRRRLGRRRRRLVGRGRRSSSSVVVVVVASRRCSWRALDVPALSRTAKSGSVTSTAHEWFVGRTPRELLVEPAREVLRSSPLSITTLIGGVAGYSSTVTLQPLHDGVVPSAVCADARPGATSTPMP